MQTFAALFMYPSTPHCLVKIGTRIREGCIGVEKRFLVLYILFPYLINYILHNSLIHYTFPHLPLLELAVAMSATTGRGVTRAVLVLSGGLNARTAVPPCLTSTPRITRRGMRETEMTTPPDTIETESGRSITIAGRARTATGSEAIGIGNANAGLTLRVR